MILVARVTDEDGVDAHEQNVEEKGQDEQTDERRDDTDDGCLVVIEPSNQANGDADGDAVRHREDDARHGQNHFRQPPDAHRRQKVILQETRHLATGVAERLARDGALNRREFRHRFDDFGEAIHDGGDETRQNGHRASRFATRAFIQVSQNLHPGEHQTAEGERAETRAKGVTDEFSCRSDESRRSGWGKVPARDGAADDKGSHLRRNHLGPEQRKHPEGDVRGHPAVWTPRATGRRNGRTVRAVLVWVETLPVLMHDPIVRHHGAVVPSLHDAKHKEQ